MNRIVTVGFLIAAALLLFSECAIDEIPIFDAEKNFNGKFSGKRIKRGLYRAKNGKIINADVNGAANILRKSKQNFDFEELCTGLLASPLRIRAA